MRTLVLTLEYPTRSSYYVDWRDAFLQSPLFASTVRNVLHRPVRRQITREIRDYDLVVVLHSCTADTLDYVADLVPALQTRRGKLVSFVGNELNLPWAPLRDKIAWLQQVRPDLIATQLLQETAEWLYAETDARICSLPHALNVEVFRPIVPQRERPIDIGARSWRYLAYIGDDERNRIFDYFSGRQFDPPLTLDLSNTQRFGRTEWGAFLNRCKATVATEAGSWYLERDDRTVLCVRKEVARARRGLVFRADAPLSRLARRLPYGVKSALRKLLRRGLVTHEAAAAEDLDFADIFRRFFAAARKAPVYGKCISSRHFDAIGCKTLQIMFPGRYNDILRPAEHYLALQPDFSNIGEVLDVLRDAVARQAIVDHAFDYAMAEHRYEHRLAALAAVLEAQPPRSTAARSLPARVHG
jgi:hypothetical protein